MTSLLMTPSAWWMPSQIGGNMSHELIHAEGVSLELFDDEWETALRIARFYGWKAAGTGTPLPMEDMLNVNTGEIDTETFEEWDGSYEGLGAFILEHDAISLADALERGLPDVLDVDAKGPKETFYEKTLRTMGYEVADKIPPAVRDRLVYTEDDPNDLAYFSGEDKKQLLALIGFLRMGQCTIW